MMVCVYIIVSVRMLRLYSLDEYNNKRFRLSEPPTAPSDLNASRNGAI